MRHRAQRIQLAWALLLLAGSLQAAAASVADETAALLRELIRIDTTNPPGNESPAARLLAKRLEAEGLTAEVMESAPGRGNLHARLPGRGTAPPVVLLSHLDVVPADPTPWRVPPFEGRREGGYVHGRGALDCKGVTAVEVFTLISLKRAGAPLDRDVILLATADEEAGGAAGAGWLAANHPELVRGAQYVVNEGDHVHASPGGRIVVQVGTAEKAPCWLRLSTSGAPGHGSTPAPETAVTRLVRALDRVRLFETPIRVTPPVAAYFAALAASESEPARSQLADLPAALDDPAFRAAFLENRRYNALVRNTITPTVLRAGQKTNVIPAEASAELDCRLLPGERPEAFMAEVGRIIADDGVGIEPLLSFPATSSDPSSGFLTAVREIARAEWPEAPVVPSVSTGFTDSHFFRDMGIASYGFVPFVLTDEDARTVHGVDERVAIENLGAGVRRLTALLRALPPPH